MKNYLLFMLVCCAFYSMNAQKTITGKVIDSELSEPLPGASVMLKGSTKGTSSQTDGTFELEVGQNEGIITISYVGFTTVEKQFSFNGQQRIDLGTIKMKMGSELEEVVLVGQDVLDVALERETPVAVSTVRSDYIREKIGNQEFPEILEQTPSIYVTKQGGGFGDARITVRGFGQVNTSVIINGQPVNDMENGRCLLVKLVRACRCSFRRSGTTRIRSYKLGYSFRRWNDQHRHQIN